MTSQWCCINFHWKYPYISLSDILALFSHYLSICFSLCASVCLSIDLSGNYSFFLFVYLCICQSVCIFLWFVFVAIYVLCNLFVFCFFFFFVNFFLAFFPRFFFFLSLIDTSLIKIFLLYLVERNVIGLHNAVVLAYCFPHLHFTVYTVNVYSCFWYICFFVFVYVFIV